MDAVAFVLEDVMSAFELPGKVDFLWLNWARVELPCHVSPPRLQFLCDHVVDLEIERRRPENGRSEG